MKPVSQDKELLLFPPQHLQHIYQSTVGFQVTTDVSHDVRVQCSLHVQLRSHVLYVLVYKYRVCRVLC